MVSLAVCNDGETVATGQVGRDAYITVWDTSTCHTISVLRDGHNNKVSSLAFTTDTKVGTLRSFKVLYYIVHWTKKVLEQPT